MHARASGFLRTRRRPFHVEEYLSSAGPRGRDVAPFSRFKDKLDHSVGPCGILAVEERNYVVCPFLDRTPDILLRPLRHFGKLRGVHPELDRVRRTRSGRRGRGRGANDQKKCHKAIANHVVHSHFPFFSYDTCAGIDYQSQLCYNIY